MKTILFLIMVLMLALTLTVPSYVLAVDMGGSGDGGGGSSESGGGGSEGGSSGGGSESGSGGEGGGSESGDDNTDTSEQPTSGGEEQTLDPSQPATGFTPVVPNENTNTNTNDNENNSGPNSSIDDCRKSGILGGMNTFDKAAYDQCNANLGPDGAGSYVGGYITGCLQDGGSITLCQQDLQRGLAGIVIRD